MSDFDKEAERERLREKYEKDQQKRETTEKMSELLLQGATMTNAHCSDCNDPIFRYDGQEFCATCEKPVDRDTGQGADGEGDDRSEEQQSGAIEVTSPSDDARVSFGGQSAEPANGERDEQSTQERDETRRERAGETGGDARSTGTGDDVSRQPEQAPSHSEQTSSSTGQQDRQPSRGEPDRQPSQGQPNRQRSGGQPKRQPPGTGSTASDVTAARDSLVRTMTRFSEQAEACEDPQRAREYLAAAREAAETLEALRR